MRCGKTLVMAFGLALSVVAGGVAAGGMQDTPSSTPVAHHRHRARVSPARLQRRVAKHAAEVQQLQQDVTRQELASKQATDRLQQQDQAIAELQKQLREARSRPAAGHP